MQALRRPRSGSVLVSLWGQSTKDVLLSGTEAKPVSLHNYQSNCSLLLAACGTSAPSFLSSFCFHRPSTVEGVPRRSKMWKTNWDSPVICYGGLARTQRRGETGSLFIYISISSCDCHNGNTGDASWIIVSVDEGRVRYGRENKHLALTHTSI